MDIPIPSEFIDAEEKRIKVGGIIIDDNKLMQEYMVSIKDENGKIKTAKSLVEIGTLVAESDE